ncbi:MAG: choice-of-anchor L domain-containing protein [Deltaproteobacteria bacterium]|nr:choice-of-anchor L domain-containing protein [Deltaproteobacteria bacterium]
MTRNTLRGRGSVALGCLGAFAVVLSTAVYGCGGSEGEVLGPQPGTGGSGGTTTEGGAGTGGSKVDGGQCAQPTVQCNNQCVDVRYDPANCGKCGTACKSGEVCSNGTCGLTCAGGTTKCGDQCVVTQSDVNNCGACGTKCAAGEFCSAGKCAGSCGGGTTQCGTNCVNVQNDPANCGACNAACQAGEVCSAGKCGINCSGGTTLCGTVCTNTQNDPANCGACATACNTGEVCSAGKCGIECMGGTTLCNNACVNVQTDPTNCGTCGTACNAGEVCSNGTCGINCSGGTTLCGTVCTNTQTDPANCGTCTNACASGEVCSAGTCGINCSGGTTLCGTICTNTQTDPANCGTCTTACAAGEVCSAGTCGINCAGGTTKCGTACVNTQIDPANCGTCANACPAGQVCSAGVCGVSCSGGTTLCGANCVNTQIDPANCGTCGTVCPAGQVCSAGACGVVCGGGTTKCGTNCVNTQNDPANCGTCGTVCAAGQYCNAGVCATISGCAPLTKCGNNCVDTKSDAANCGACGTVCAAGAKCVNSVCVQCDSTTTDCDGDGWKASDGDCCDKPGTCGAEPALVNPGAIEVVGNGIDDNCNGKADLFDTADTVACDTGIASNTTVAGDYAKTIGICRTTTETPPLAQKTWGLISAQILRADGSALGDTRAISTRSTFGSINPATTEGTRVMVMSSGIASDGTQTTPGPNGGAPGGGNVTTAHNPASTVAINAGTLPYNIKDWYALPNPPMKAANALPNAPGCTAGNANQANDSVMLVLRMRAPTNVKAFSFNSFFLSAEYPEYVCSTYNDQFIALVDTPSGTPSPIPNPPDKNLMTYTAGNQKWPIGINIAHGTTLFSVCDALSMGASCGGTQVTAGSCGMGAGLLTGTGFEKPTAATCLIGGGTFWLTTAGNVIPGQIVEVRIVIWDVGDTAFDSLAIIDGFKWLANATLPGTG